MARTLTGNNRRREQRLQELMILRLSAQYERRMGREIARAMRAAAKAVSDGRISPADQIRERHEANVSRILADLYRRSSTDMAEHMTGNQRAWHGKLEAKQADVAPTPIVDRLMQTWLNTILVTKVKQITKTTQEDIRRITSEGVRDGLSEREIGKMIRDIAPTKSASRSQTIARTEVHASSQASAQAVADAAELDMVRVWVSSKGERTRDDHREVDGQKRGMHEPFLVGNDLLMFPGDPSGRPGQVINCRCAVVFELA